VKYAWRGWKLGNRLYAYTPHRQQNGKFKAFIYDFKKNKDIKRRSFGKRKTAKAKAYEWYLNRKRVLDRIREKRKKPEPTKADLIKKKLQHCEDQIKLHTTRIRRQETLVRKWNRKRKYYKRKLKEVM